VKAVDEWMCDTGRAKPIKKPSEDYLNTVSAGDLVWVSVDTATSYTMMTTHSTPTVTWELKHTGDTLEMKA